MKTIVTLAILSLSGLAWHPLAAAAAGDPGISLHPDHIEIGAAYDGTRVSVSGRVPSGASALVRLTGPPEDRRLKQKGRALGLLWMNLASVEISRVPDVFLLYLPEGTPAEKTTGDSPWRPLGLKGVEAHADIVATDPDKAAIFDEFVKLKEKAGLYGVIENAVHYGTDDGRMKAFHALLTLPAALPQGRYRVEVLTMANGAVSTMSIHEIDAREVGMPAWISTLAFGHGTLYGVLAVLVAVIAGLVSGVMFKDKGGAH